ncbi:GntR family transcriptional regulator [Streptomyces sp. NPDC004752]
MATATYLRLADELADAMKDAPPGTRLPSENELAAQHQVSRLTSRMALEELQRRHLVSRTRGSGTYVARRLEYTVSDKGSPSWTETVKQAGGKPEISVLSVETMHAPASLRETLRLTENTQVVKLVRLGKIDGIPANYNTMYFPADLAPGFSDLLSNGGSTHKLMVALGFAPRRLWMSAELEVVDEEAGRHLLLDGRPLVWRFRSCLVDTKTGRRVETADGWTRPDVLRVKYELGDTE